MEIVYCQVDVANAIHSSIPKELDNNSLLWFLDLQIIPYFLIFLNPSPKKKASIHNKLKKAKWEF